MEAIEVRIDSRFPVFIKADADSFGSIFAHMDSEEQVAVLTAMVQHMKSHPTQWDYISIQLEKPENVEVWRTLRSVLFPAHAT